MNSKDLAPLDTLLPKQRLFISLILSGKGSVEAHRMAGYRGDAHAAYELRSKLEKAIAAQAKARGVSREGVMADLAALDSLPVKADSVSVDQKLRLVDLKRRFLEGDSEAHRAPKLTAFVIEKQIVDAEIIKSEAPAVGAERVSSEPEQAQDANTGQHNGQIGERGKASAQQSVSPNNPQTAG